MGHLNSTEIGQRIKLYRQKAGLTQESLGELVGVTFQQIQKYERGITKLNIDKLQRIAEALSVPVPALIEAEEATHIFLTSQEKKLIEMYRRMNDEIIKECLFKIMEKLEER